MPRFRIDRHDDLWPVPSLVLLVCLVTVGTLACSPTGDSASSPGASSSTTQDSGPLELILAGGRVIDPESGLDAIRHVGVREGVVVAVSEQPLDERLAQGGTLLDATGLVVAPGFIDLHAHGQSDSAHEYQARDGVTTALELEWGYPELSTFLESREGRSRVNFGASVAHGLARAVAMADEAEREPMRRQSREAASRDEPLRDLQAVAWDARYEELPPQRYPDLDEEIERGLREGGLGIGMAHQYYPGANRQEIFHVFQLAAEQSVPIFTHVRAMEIDAMQEVLANAAATGASLHIVHVNSMSLGHIDTVLELITGARARGIDVSTEAYPYTAASTGLDSTIFDPGWQDRLSISYGDLQWESSGERLTAETFERYRGTNGTVIIHMMKDEWIDHALGNDWVMVASDGMPYAPGAHPRTAGTFSRVLGRYVRERQVLDLPGAIRKMSLLPAQRLTEISPQMAKKGRVQPGFDADLTVFDPERVIDRATFEDGLAFSEGIVHVVVNGVPVVLDSRSVEGAFPGRAIRGHTRGTSAP